MLTQHRQLAQDYAGDCRHDNGRAEHTYLVDVGVDDVERVNTRGGTKNEHGNYSSGDTRNQGGLKRGGTHLFGSSRAYHLQQRDQRGDTGQGQREEEEDTKQGSTRHFVNNGGEGNEGQGDTGQALQLVNTYTLLVGHETQGAKYTETSQYLEGRVSKCSYQTGTHQVSLLGQVGSVSQHDAETNGKRVEDLRVSRNPNLGLTQRIKVGGPQGVKAIYCTGQEQGAHYQHYEQQHQQGQEDLVCALNTAGYTLTDNGNNHGPHHYQGNNHVPYRAGVVANRARQVQELVEEEVLGTIFVLGPGGVNRIEGVTQGPADNYGVVGHDDEAHYYVPPAQPLPALGHTAEHCRGGSTVAVADSVVEQ